MSTIINHSLILTALFTAALAGSALARESVSEPGPGATARDKTAGRSHDSKPARDELRAR